MKSIQKHPAMWVPTLYFAEALPYVVVMTLSTIMYTNLGLSNTELAFYTGWLYLPWVIKPLWSPIVDSLRTKRWWIIAMQLLVGASLAAVALTLQTDWWLRGSLAFFWLMAFSSATHDIAADGFYILGLNEHDQALYVGIRSTAYRVGMIFCQGLIVVLAGYLEERYNVPLAWSITMVLMALLMVVLAGWHTLTTQSQTPQAQTPQPQTPQPPKGGENSTMNQISEGSFSPFRGVGGLGLGLGLGLFLPTLRAFASKPHLWSALLFMLLFRFPEAQLAKMAQPFMLRPLDEGGLALDTISLGFIYGTVGVIALLLGGILGGVLVSRHGLKRWWWPMVMAISLPDLVYIYFAMCQPQSLLPVYLGVALEQLGYGFGFTAYSLFLVYFSRGERSTSVFSLCTGLQALGMMLPGMMAGWLADQLGFTNFFIWVALCCLVTFAVSAKVVPKN